VRRGIAVAVLIGGAAWAMTMVPYLLGHLTAPPGKVFNGFFYIADDAATYVSKMREGAEGAWGWTDRYISRPHPTPVLLFSFYIVAGKVAALLHLPLVAAYHLARLTGAVALVAAVRALALEALEEERQRRVALALVLIGSGLGYLAVLAHQPNVAGEQVEALDLHLPELSGLYSILAIPHFAWAAALMAWAVALLLRISAEARPATALKLAATLLVMTLIHPQMLFILGPLAVLQLGQSGAGPRAWLYSGAAFAASLPLLGYFLAILSGDEVVRAWSHQWHHQAPGPLSMILALGIPLGLAAIGGWMALRDGSPRRRLLLAWVVLVVALLYIPNPVNIQRRLLDGLYIPVALLAAAALATLGPATQRRRREFLAVALSSVSSFFVVLIGVSWALSQQSFIYVSSDAVSVMAAMARVPRDPCLPPVVLAHPETGLQIPAMAGYRVFTGHYSETLDYQARSRAGLSALQAGGAVLREFMTVNEITLAWIGPTERASRAAEPGEGFAVAFQSGDTRVYRLDPAPSYAVPIVRPTGFAALLSGSCSLIVEPVPPGP
jgi:hypothetical protein